MNGNLIFVTIDSKAVFYSMFIEFLRRNEGHRDGLVYEELYKEKKSICTLIRRRLATRAKRRRQKASCSRFVLIDLQTKMTITNTTD